MHGQRIGRRWLGLGALVLALLLPSAAGAAWSSVGGPSGTLVLNGIEARTATDVWAVGQTSDYRTHTQHWDGRRWTVVPSPNVPGSFISTLHDVSAVSATDVWAVGDDGGGTPLVIHWDGNAWSSVPLPPLTGFTSLRSVSARTATDVWIVGWTSSSRTLALRWDGTSLAVVPTPNPSTTTVPYNFLNDVHALGADDAWAVGTYARRGQPPQTLAMRWNGTRWLHVASPAPPGPSGLPVYSRLEGVTAISATDAWAVGTVGNQSLALRWNGSSWSVVPTPNVRFEWNLLQDVEAAATGDVWAVGVSQRVFYSGQSQFTADSTLIQRWNGTAWTIVSSPSPIRNASALRAVSVATATDVWASGAGGITLRGP